MRRTLAVVSVLAVVLSLAPLVAAGQDKVVICHVPPGNPDAAHTITVGAPAVEEHMGEHGDTMGPCAGEQAKSPKDDGNPSQDTGPSPSSAAAFPATSLWLLLVALAAGVVATVYVLRRRRNGAR